MKLLSALCLLLPLSAAAHVTPGTYTGKNAEGASCSMTAGETYFAGNPHPLNERIAITVGSDEFTVGHPPVLDFANAVAFFNHDVFQGVLATKTGARAVEIEMVHEEGREGPAAFTFVENFWKSGQKTSYRCEGLTLNR